MASIGGNVELSTHWHGNDSGCLTVVRGVSLVERSCRTEACSAIVMAKSPMMHVRERGDRVSTALRNNLGRKRFPFGEVVVGSRRVMTVFLCRLRTRMCLYAL